MKKIFLVVPLSVALYGCQDDPIDIVKESKFPLDPTYTVEQVFENRKLCDSISWEDFENERGRITVEYRCSIKDTGDAAAKAYEEVMWHIEKQQKDQSIAQEKALKRYLHDIEKVERLLDYAEDVINNPEDSSEQFDNFRKEKEQNVFEIADSLWNIKCSKSQKTVIDNQCISSLKNWREEMHTKTEEIKYFIDNTDSRIENKKKALSDRLLKSADQIFQWGIVKYDGKYSPELTYAGFEVLKYSGEYKVHNENINKMINSVYSDSLTTIREVRPLVPYFVTGAGRILY